MTEKSLTEKINEGLDKFGKSVGEFFSNPVATKITIYGGNILASSIGKNFANAGVGNPVGAVCYSALDALGAISEKVKYNKYTRLAKVGGAVGYTIPTLSVVVPAVMNFSLETKDLLPLALNGSMAYQLIADTYRNYRHGEEDIFEDIKEVKDDISERFRSLKNLKIFRKSRNPKKSKTLALEKRVGNEIPNSSF